VHLIVHPQLAVRRNDDGTLEQILDIDVDQAPPGALIESWMRIEVERDFVSDDLDPLINSTRRVLNDVRRAVADWHPMRDQAHRIAHELNQHPPTGIDSHEIHETRALLEWLADNNLTFLGYREYDLVTIDGEDALRPVPDSGLGILRQVTQNGQDDDAVSLSFAILPTAVRSKAREHHLLILSKANSRSTVHRAAYMDYVGIKKFDADGNVVGERRFLGLYAASAYNHSVADIPILRDKLDYVMRALGLHTRIA
jgi:NAD-specific glutamate dehydrogenase